MKSRTAGKYNDFSAVIKADFEAVGTILPKEELRDADKIRRAVHRCRERFWDRLGRKGPSAIGHEN